MRILAFAAAASVLFACSSSDGHPSGPPLPGCDRSTVYGVCVAEAGLTAADCTSGTFVSGGCPTTSDWVGACADVTSTTYYYGPGYDAYSQHLACEQAGGAWMAAASPPATAWCDVAVLTSALCMDLAGPENEVVPATAVFSYFATCSATGACPTSGRTGSCTGASGNVEISVRYYDPATVADDAASCTADGDVWTPG